MNDMKSNKCSMLIRKYVFNITTFRMLVGVFFLSVTLFDLHRTGMIRAEMNKDCIVNNIDFSSLESALKEQLIVIAVYLLLVLLYAWKLKSNKFLRRYLIVIDVFVLLYVFCWIYFCVYVIG